MPRFYFEKLVRDKILERCLEDPKVLHTEYATLGDIALKQELVKKVLEEAAEVPIVPEANDDVVGEIADIQAVLDALRKAYGISKEALDAAVQKKADKNGAFDDAIYIDYVDLADDSEWVETFRQQPDKYREE